MGIESKDRDWVVVGSNPDEMRALGFRSVGKGFPVFLHPETAEEYALARTERKVSRGYHGFEFVSDPSVTLEQDLMRRDLTINAIAQRPDGSLVDPWGGAEDIEKKLLRHVSPAFNEDPVRVLRVARFAARFADQGFMVDDATQALMRRMVTGGEVDSLVAERVWQEMQDALGLRGFARFIEVLRETGALNRILPEVDRLFGVPQNPAYHPEVDTGLHVLMALQVAGDEQASVEEMFAVLMHDLGKGVTPSEEWPRHIKHEVNGIAPINALCDRLRVPNVFRQLALKVCRYHLLMHQLRQLKPETVLKLIEDLDGFRNPDQLHRFIRCCRFDQRGRLGLKNAPYPQGEYLLRLFNAACEVGSREVIDRLDRDNRTGSAIKDAIRLARIKAIRQEKNAIL